MVYIGVRGILAIGPELVVFANFNGRLRLWPYHCFNGVFVMRIARQVHVLRFACATAVCLIFAFDSAAQTVWSGLTFTHTNVDFSVWEEPENQDRITDNVWLTRQHLEGLFNINQETGYIANVSPADTEWATDLMPENDGEAIEATNWEDLTFTDWINAYGGQGSQNLPALLMGRNAVVHLITDDVYLDLQFTDWTQGFGGGFSYDRAEGSLAPEPTGDYNGNGVVDAADYVEWRSTLDQPAVPAGSGADGDESGTIDAGDSAFWAARFGNTVPGAGGGAGGTAVPEPATIALLLVGAVFVACCAGRAR